MEVNCAYKNSLAQIKRHAKTATLVRPHQLNKENIPPSEKSLQLQQFHCKYFAVPASSAQPAYSAGNRLDAKPVKTAARTKLQTLADDGASHLPTNDNIYQNCLRLVSLAQSKLGKYRERQSLSICVHAEETSCEKQEGETLTAQKPQLDASVNLQRQYAQTQRYVGKIKKNNRASQQPAQSTACAKSKNTSIFEQIFDHSDQQTILDLQFKIQELEKYIASASEQLARERKTATALQARKQELLDLARARSRALESVH